MAQESFYDVLVEQIRSELRAEMALEFADAASISPAPSVAASPHTCAASLTEIWLATHLSPKSFKSPRAGYMGTLKQKGRVALLGSSPKSVSPRPPHNFTPEQLCYFQKLLNWGTELQENFTTSELKSAYRKLALRFHPDRHLNASSEELLKLRADFSLLKEAYQSLSQII